MLCRDACKGEASRVNTDNGNNRQSDVVSTLMLPTSVMIPVRKAITAPWPFNGLERGNVWVSNCWYPPLRERKINVWNTVIDRLGDYVRTVYLFYFAQQGGNRRAVRDSYTLLLMYLHEKRPWSSFAKTWRIPWERVKEKDWITAKRKERIELSKQLLK